MGSIAPACQSRDLTARITVWDGAAGHRIATVELTIVGTSACTIPALLQPQLVDGKGEVLINGQPSQTPPTLTMAQGSILETLVQDGNYCGPAPLPPVTVAFVFPSAGGRIIATAVSSTDTFGVPPCLGTPGSPGDIEMQPWKG